MAFERRSPSMSCALSIMPIIARPNTCSQAGRCERPGRQGGGASARVPGRSHCTGGGAAAGAELTGDVVVGVVLHPPGRAATSSGVWAADSLDHSHFFESQATALIEWCG
jgi:hypothetical protein